MGVTGGTDVDARAPGKACADASERHTARKGAQCTGLAARASECASHSRDAPAGIILLVRPMDETPPKAPSSGKRLVGSLFGKVQSAGAAALHGVKLAGSTAVAERFESAADIAQRRCFASAN